MIPADRQIISDRILERILMGYLVFNMGKVMHNFLIDYLETD